MAMSVIDKVSNAKLVGKSWMEQVIGPFNSKGLAVHVEVADV